MQGLIRASTDKRSLRDITLRVENEWINADCDGLFADGDKG